MDNYIALLICGFGVITLIGFFVKGYMDIPSETKPVRRKKKRSTNRVRLKSRKIG